MSADQPRTVFVVEGMSCGHCENAVREEVSTVVGVESLEVSAATGRLVVVGSVDQGAVIAAVDEAGYGAQAIPASRAGREEA